MIVPVVEGLLKRRPFFMCDQGNNVIRGSYSPEEV